MMRRGVVFLAAVIALIGGLSAAFATIDARDYDLRGYVDATQDANLPYRVPRLGVNAELLQYDAEELRQQFQWMQAAHVTWVRQFVDWSQVEPEQGVFEWGAWDSITEALREFPDLRLVVVFVNSPDWARNSAVITAPPDDPTVIVPFMQAFAERYGEQVDFYQIWDEPNLYAAWGNADPRPAEYAALLAETYGAIHAVDGDATVIAAALAPTIERSGQNIADVLYLEALYDVGAADYFDAAAGKPYGFDSAPDDRQVSLDALNFSRLIALREVMVAHGDGGKALWASNWGWNSLPDDWTGDDSIWGEVSQQEQIDYTLAALNRAEREWAWLGGMVLQHWQPNVAADNPQWGFALINPDNQPSALWQALAAREPSLAAMNGLYHPLNAYARYSGVWTFSKLGADIGWLETSDSQFEWDFVGTDAALLLHEDDYFAFLYPAIDGEAANATPRDNQGNAYVLLRSESRELMTSLVPIARNLNDDNHTLHVVADKGWDRWALAGFAVSSGNLAEPYNRQLALAWLTSALAFAAVLISGYRMEWQKLLARLGGLDRYVNASWQLGIGLVTSLALMVGMLLTWGQPEATIFRRDMFAAAAVLSAGLLLYKFSFLLVVAAVLVLFVLIYNRLQIGLMLVVLYAPFFLFPVELYNFAFPMAEMLLLITTVAWVLRVFAHWGYLRQSATEDAPLRLRIKLNSIDWVVLAWGVLGIFAVLWSARFGQAITEYRTLILEPILFYVILRWTQPKIADLQRLVYALMTAGVLVAGIGLVMYGLGESIITAEDGALRLASVYGSPNNVGLLLGRVVPFVLVMIVFTPPHAGAIHHAPTVRRYGAMAALGLMLLAVVLTQSVGALLFGIPAGMMAIVLLRWRWRAVPFLAGVAVLGVIAIAILTQVSPRFASLLDMSTGTNFMRLRVWESSLEIISKQPLTGLGLDQFLYDYRGAYVRPDAIFDPDLSHPHNIVLDFWIRLGLLGVGLLIAMQVAFWRRARQLWQVAEMRGILAGSMGAMVALLAHGLIDNSVYVQDLALVFVLLLGIMGASRVEESHDEI